MMSNLESRRHLKVLLALALAVGFFPASRALNTPPESRRIELLGAGFDPLMDGEPSMPAALRARDDSAYALLQLAEAPGRADLDALRAAGVVFHDPIAGNAYLVRLAAHGGMGMAARRAEIAALRPVRWIGPLHGAYKISPGTAGGTLLVDLFPDADLAAAAAAAVGAGAKILERSDGDQVKLLIVQAGADLLPALAAIEGVRWVQDKPVYSLVNDDARYVVQANQRGELPLYARGLSGAGQVGGVSDSGLDAFDFNDVTGAPIGVDPNDAGCYFIDDGNGGDGGPQIPPGPAHRKVIGYRVPTGAEGDFTDESGHGTHVTGSVVGDQRPWGEVSSADGQAYEAKIFFQDINVGGGLTVNPPADYFNNLFGQAYDFNGNGVYDPALEPRTHSNSWGSADSTYDAQTAQTDRFMWVRPDFLILFAAGNQGPGPLTVGNPGTAKNIVTVGATENGDGEPNNMADFSSHGPIPASGPPGGGNRLSPTIGAPGVGLLSALFKNACGTQELSGTSMATPTTQGVALLMRQYLWDGYYPHGEPTAGDELRTPPPSAALLKALLVNSGQRMTGLFTDNGGGGSWPSNGQGWGRVRADDALYFQGDHRDLWVHDEYSVGGTTGFNANGQSRTFTIQVGDGSPFESEPLEVTLVWTDYPGSMLDGGRLVNNLNLVVTDPLGGTHRGNDPAQNDFNNTTDLPASPDAVNPWEVVYLASPTPGTYTIAVTAATLGSLASDPARKQGFALVATGDLRGRRGRAEIEKASYNPIPTIVARLRVTDTDRNADPQSAEPVTARLTSTTDPAGIVVTLQETAPDSATFAGQATLVIPNQGQILGPNQIAVQKGDTIRLSYADANDGAGRSFEAFDTARVEDPSVSLLNPPGLADPGETDPDGNFTLNWSPAELSNNRGLTRTLAFYVVEESTDYHLTLFDDAEGIQTAHWTTELGTEFSQPWTKDSTYNHTQNPPPPGESYWSQGVESGANVLDVDTRLVLNQDVTIPAAVGSARLTFYSRYFNEPDDTGTVEISTDGGASWTELLKVSDAPQTPPPDTRMQHHEVDLSAYRGQPFRIRFRFISTSNFFLFVTTGWWVDDVTLSGATWHGLAVVPANQTQYQVTGRFDGEHFYRVRSVYTDGTASAFSNVEEIFVQGPGTPAGRVPSGAPDTPLTVSMDGNGDLTLQWGASCLQTDTDYEVYEGTIGDYDSHAPVLCSTGGQLSATVTPGSGNRYYLIVPRNTSSEGSYGLDSSGNERPAGAQACGPRRIDACF
jgi:subtilase family protein